ncbi:DNA repair protein RecO (recombination protein O) [Angulomicrobium tetraedrale]|uniref:DNA repair protein RecO n=1 Tax=Ancylobacter tetraedralis TaxID=217068 RepID=A0A839ZE21_9HYPH|nr:DNA repair protein RecO [Ancylobacter tetraedralis]MBB3772958.1 DNA repair protein RecO (recombination protein O) [Ancylobacter tetraedralis]
MEWVDDGIIVGLRRHGEANAIVELLTVAHGRHLGLVRGGGSRRQAAALQPGNSVRASWRARLDEHLGAFTLEVTRARAGRLMGEAHSAFALAHVGALLRLLPERDPHPGLHLIVETMVEHLAEPRLTGMMVARFELMMLSELGFGLDLSSCAATGGRNDLLYVSPKSGRAVSRDAGEPWRDRLLGLPFFLISEVAEPPPSDEIRTAFALTGYFLAQRVFAPRGLTLPDARQSLLTALDRAAARLPPSRL